MRFDQDGDDANEENSLINHSGCKSIGPYSSTYLEASTRASTMFNDTSLSHDKTGDHLLGEKQFLDQIMDSSGKGDSNGDVDDAEGLQEQDQSFMSFIGQLDQTFVHQAAYQYFNHGAKVLLGLAV